MLEKYLALIRITDLQYAEKLVNEGEVFMNSINSWANLYDNIGRGDQFEGADKVEPIRKIVFGGSNNLSKLLNKGTLTRGIYCTQPQININSFCMTSILESDIGKEKYFDDRLKQFGDSFVLIRYVNTFTSLIKEQLNKEKSITKHNWDKVQYYDEFKSNFDLTPFHKRKSLAWQKEVRYIARNENDGPITIKIGNISKIADIFPIDMLNKVKAIHKHKNIFSIKINNN